MIRIGLDHTFDFPGFEEISGIVLQMQNNGGSTRGLFGFLNSEGSKTIGLPGVSLVAASFTRRDNNLIGHHEGGIETHAEPPDQVRRVFGLLYKGLGARLGNGTQIAGKLLGRHADPCID